MYVIVFFLMGLALLFGIDYCRKARLIILADKKAVQLIGLGSEAWSEQITGCSAIDLIDKGWSPGDIAQKLTNISPVESAVRIRLDALLRYTGGKQAVEASEILSAQQELAFNRLLSLPRYCISVLLFLGLVGTVLGLANTVGNLPQVINGGDITKLSPQIGEAIRPMQNAFMSTLVGIVSSILLSLLVQIAIMSYETHVLKPLDDFCSGVLVPILSLSPEYEEFSNASKRLEATTNAMNEHVATSMRFTETQQTVLEDFKAALVGFNTNVTNTSDAFRTTVGDTGTVFRTTVGEAGDTLKDAATESGGKLTAAGNDVFTNLTLASGQVRDDLTGFGNTVSAAGVAFNTTIEASGTAFKTTVGDTGTAFKTTVGDTGTAFKTTVGEAGDTLKEAATESGGKLTAAGDDVFTNLTLASGQVRDDLTGFGNTVSASGTVFKTTIGEAGDTLKDAATASGGKLTAAGDDVFTNLTLASGQVRDDLTGFGNTVSASGTAFNTTIEASGTAFKTTVGEAGDTLKEAATESGGKLTAAGDDVFTNLTLASGQVRDDLTGFGNTVSTAGTSFETMVGNTGNAFKTMVGDTGTVFRTTVGEAGDTLKEAATESGGKLTAAGDDVFTNLTTGSSQASSDLTASANAFETAMRDTTKWMSDTGVEIRTTLQNLAHAQLEMGNAVSAVKLAVEPLKGLLSEIEKAASISLEGIRQVHETGEANASNMANRIETLLTTSLESIRQVCATEEANAREIARRIETLSESSLHIIQQVHETGEANTNDIASRIKTLFAERIRDMIDQAAKSRKDLQILLQEHLTKIDNTQNRLNESQDKLVALIGQHGVNVTQSIDNMKTVASSQIEGYEINSRSDWGRVIQLHTHYAEEFNKIIRLQQGDLSNIEKHLDGAVENLKNLIERAQWAFDDVPPPNGLRTPPNGTNT